MRNVCVSVCAEQRFDGMSIRPSSAIKHVLLAIIGWQNIGSLFQYMCVCVFAFECLLVDIKLFRSFRSNGKKRCKKEMQQQRDLHQ